jgi:1,2-diacylglycerol-3-alpha-glucose alpha-1,2-galactosyltransferase
MKQPPDNLTFTGLLRREQVVDYYRAADLFFLPSMQETFGIVVVEAAAAGLPVLLRDINQYHETFGRGYERGSDATFIAQIERFAHDHKYYAEWQSAAGEIARRYDSRAGAQRLLGIYQEILDVGNKKGRYLND